MTANDSLRDDLSDTTDDRALDGRLLLRQPRRGHRFGHDAMLLAAACGAQPGETAVEFGAGVGAAGLALATRVAGLRLIMAEIDPELARLAQHNAACNGLADRARAVACDVTARDLPERLGVAAGGVDHVLMNPPFNDPARQNLSPDAGRRLAHAMAPAELSLWIGAAARLLKPSGELTLIWRAGGLDDVLAALVDMFGAIAVLPVHPRPGAPAIRVLVRAVKASRQPLAMLPGVVLAGADGRPSAAAEAVLRHAAPLRFHG